MYAIFCEANLISVEDNEESAQHAAIGLYPEEKRKIKKARHVASDGQFHHKEGEWWGAEASYHFAAAAKRFGADFPYAFDENLGLVVDFAGAPDWTRKFAPSPDEIQQGGGMWWPTHILHEGDAGETLVMLCDGSLYTLQEWEWAEAAKIPQSNKIRRTLYTLQEWEWAEGASYTIERGAVMLHGEPCSYEIEDF